MKFNWKKEFARDIVALGSIPFYLLVIVRLLVWPKWFYVTQIAGAFILIIVALYFLKKLNGHLARAFPLFVFTSLYYADIRYTILSFLIYTSMIFSLHYLKHKNKEIILGILLGFLATIISYSIAYFSF